MTVDTAGNPIDPDVPPAYTHTQATFADTRAALIQGRRDAAALERIAAWLANNGHEQSIINADGNAADAAISLLQTWAPRVAAQIAQYAPPPVELPDWTEPDTDPRHTS